jgi:hypothetical protein
MAYEIISGNNVCIMTLKVCPSFSFVKSPSELVEEQEEANDQMPGVYLFLMFLKIV